jgi:hypothetical protein
MFFPLCRKPRTRGAQNGDPGSLGEQAAASWLIIFKARNARRRKCRPNLLSYAGIRNASIRTNFHGPHLSSRAGGVSLGDFCSVFSLAGIELWGVAIGDSAYSRLAESSAYIRRESQR